MTRWTNERWMSTLHRVKSPVVDGTIDRRRSTAAVVHNVEARTPDALIAAAAPKGLPADPQLLQLPQLSGLRRHRRSVDITAIAAASAPLQ